MRTDVKRTRTIEISSYAQPDDRWVIHRGGVWVDEMLVHPPAAAAIEAGRERFRSMHEEQSRRLERWDADCRAAVERTLRAGSMTESIEEGSEDTRDCYDVEGWFRHRLAGTFVRHGTLYKGSLIPVIRNPPDTIQKGEFDIVFGSVSRATNEPVMVERATSLADVRAGDWVYFLGDSSFAANQGYAVHNQEQLGLNMENEHDANLVGAWTGENSIALNAGGANLWAHPSGITTSVHVIGELNTISRQLAQRIGRPAPAEDAHYAWTRSYNAAVVGQKVFDHRRANP